MALKVLDSGTITCTDTTYVGTLGYLKTATIKKIQILASASSDFWIYCDNAGPTQNTVVQPIDEDILGATGSKITVNTTLTAYPLKNTVTTGNAATSPLAYVPLIVSGNIVVSAANVAAADTFRIMIWYDDEE